MKRFDIITEADARSLDIGATVELAAGGHVTPLARDTLATRRITVIPAGSADSALPADLAPTAEIRRVAIGSDHTGVAMKRSLVAHLRGRGLAVLDVGTDGTDPVDYPDIAAAVATLAVLLPALRSQETPTLSPPATRPVHAASSIRPFERRSSVAH